MPDPASPHTATSPRSNAAARSGPRSFFDRLTALLHQEPEDREQLKAILEAAHARDLLDAEALAMIEGVMAVSELAVGEILVPRPRMDMIDAGLTVVEQLPFVLETAHSRFPVFEGDRDNVIGLLLAKDLLRAVGDPSLSIKSLIRPITFIPESKRLNMLLREFRNTHQHMAVVVDEHGGVAGLITIEDVLEQIVGEIEDEHDDEIAEQPIMSDGRNRWRVMATVKLNRFNQHFGTDIDDTDHGTIGGWLAGELGRIPRRGDRCEVDSLRVDVIRADARRALWLRVERVKSAAESNSHA